MASAAAFKKLAAKEECQSFRTQVDLYPVIIELCSVCCVCTNRLEYGYESTEYWVRMNQNVGTNELKCGYESTGYESTWIRNDQFPKGNILLKNGCEMMIITATSLAHWLYLMSNICSENNNIFYLFDKY